MTRQSKNVHRNEKERLQPDHHPPLSCVHPSAASPTSQIKKFLVSQEVRLFNSAENAIWTIPQDLLSNLHLAGRLQDSGGEPSSWLFCSLEARPDAKILLDIGVFFLYLFFARHHPLPPESDVPGGVVDDPHQLLLLDALQPVRVTFNALRLLFLLLFVFNVVANRTLTGRACRETF